MKKDERADARYNPDKWEYTSKYINDKFIGKLDDPNVVNKGITGFTFSPERHARKNMMNDFKSGNILFD